MWDITFASFLQPPKAPLPILVSVAGRVMLVRCVLLNAPSSNVSNEDGSVISVKKHHAKAFAPISLTVFGMLIFSNPQRPQNASEPMRVTPSGMIVVRLPTETLLVFVWITALQLLRES